MIKNILLIFLLTVSIESMAQSQLFPETPEGLVQYSGDQTTDRIKSDIYKGLKLWVAAMFADPSVVVTMDDQVNGILKLKYNFPFEGQPLYTSLLIRYKDNRYIYTFSDIYKPTEARFQHNLTAEGINRRIRERTDKGKIPMPFLTDYVLIANKTIRSMEKSLNETINNKPNF